MKMIRHGMTVTSIQGERGPSGPTGPQGDPGVGFPGAKVIECQDTLKNSEGSCDTEGWSNDAENSALHHRNQLHFKIYCNKKAVYNISEYYCFCCIFLSNTMQPW